LIPTELLEVVMATATVPDRIDRFLTRAQAAEILGLSPATLARYAMLGTGPKFSKQNSRLVRYLLSDVQQYMADFQSNR
jgi:predicted DNA-binding transcriptional regulator AlpA